MSLGTRSYLSHSPEQTLAIGQQLGRTLPPQSVIALHGDLGAGKTQLIKGIVTGACGLPAEVVNSPTFVYLNIYQGTQTLYHFDLYRLTDSAQFLSMGFDEYFDAGGICCLEWAERIQGLLPSRTIEISLRHQGEEDRLISVTGR